MHETSLVTNLLRQVDELAATHGESRVVEVSVEIGLLSNVEPLLLREAFERLKLGTSAERAELRLDDIGLTNQCRSCDNLFSTRSLQFVCPRCRSGDVVVTRGDAVTFVSASFDANQEPACS